METAQQTIEEMNRITQVHTGHIELMRKAQVPEYYITESVAACAKESFRPFRTMLGDPPSPIVGYVVQVLTPADDSRFEEAQQASLFVDTAGAIPDTGDMYLLYGIDGVVKEITDPKGGRYGLVLYDSAQEYADEIKAVLSTPGVVYLEHSTDIDPRILRYQRCTLLDVLQERGDLRRFD